MLARAGKTAFVQLDDGAYNSPLTLRDSQDAMRLSRVVPVTLPVELREKESPSCSPFDRK
jgi:hypothetical protein